MSNGQEAGLVWLLAVVCVALLWRSCQLWLDLARERQRARGRTIVLRRRMARRVREIRGGGR